MSPALSKGVIPHCGGGWPGHISSQLGKGFASFSGLATLPAEKHCLSSDAGVLINVYLLGDLRNKEMHLQRNQNWIVKSSREVCTEGTVLLKPTWKHSADRPSLLTPHQALL